MSDRARRAFIWGYVAGGAVAAFLLGYASRRVWEQQQHDFVR